MKKRLCLIFAALIVISVACLVFTGCGKDEETLYKVTFTSEGGVYREISVKEGEAVTLPDPPVRSGYTFLGWQLDGTDWDGSSAITKDITLVAKWEEGSLGYELEFSLSESGDYYTVTGIGEASYAILHIPSEYKGLPVKEISTGALRGSEYLREVTIPASVTVIGDEALSECPCLTAIYVEDGNPGYKTQNGDLYTKDGTRLIQYAIAKSDTAFTLPNTAVEIAPRAFSMASSLEKIVIHSSIRAIGRYAFSKCTSLTSADIPYDAPLTALASSAFSGCKALTEVSISSQVESIGDFAFFNCSSLKRVDLGKKCSLTSIGNSAFLECPSLTEFVYGGSSYAFYSKVTVGEANDNLYTALYPYLGGMRPAMGAWEPTAEYTDIVYGVWQTEEDYLNGAPPVKWYSEEEIASKTLGTIANDGLEYEDPDFIPGYAHFYKDATLTKEQLTVGREQKLIIDLGGHTLTTSKGMRIGGTDGVFPKASLIIRNGEFISQFGCQIQPRAKCYFEFNNVSIIEDGSVSFLYGVRAREFVISHCDFYINSNTYINLLAAFDHSGEYIQTFKFISTDIYVNPDVRTTHLFRISENKWGVARWEIIFDKDSSLTGCLDLFIILKESATNENHYSFSAVQTIIFEEGFTFNDGAEPPMNYTLTPYDKETLLEQEAVNLPVNDGVCNVIVGRVPEPDGEPTE